MKKLLLFAAIFLAASLVRADVVIVLDVVTADGASGTTTIKIKGNLARNDSAVGGGKASTMIYDFAKGKLTVLMDAHKAAQEIDFGVLKLDQAPQSPQRPKAVGRQEKVGAWNADIYEGAIDGRPTKLWVAKDVPEAKAHAPAMSKLAKIAPVLPDLSRFDIAGTTVKTEITIPQSGTLTTTIASIKEAPVADSEFVVPASYLKMPGLAPSPAVGAGARQP